MKELRFFSVTYALDDKNGELFAGYLYGSFRMEYQ